MESINQDKEWREYQQLVDLYQFYLDLVVKTVAAYFVIVGAILTVVLANVDSEPIIVISLVVPVLLSLLLAIGARRAKPQVTELRQGMDELGAALRVRVTPHIQILDQAVGGLGFVMLCATLVLIALFAWLTVTRWGT
jgi:hypothetical protein